MRLRGFVTPAGFEASIGVHPAELLGALVESGHVRHIEARDMYALTPEGKVRHAELFAESSTAAVGAGLAEAYPRFLELNDRFKSLCTDWQVRDDAPNDHTDADYDRDCIERLIALDAASDELFAALATALPRLARYASRLHHAKTCVVAGDRARFTGVMCESYHDIWMELHEDLIVMQHIDRVTEGSF